MNGYFQLIIENGNTYMKLIPPTNGGSPVEQREIQRYLSSNNIECNYELIFEQVSKREETPFLIMMNTIPEIAETVVLYVSDDKSRATMELCPPSKNGAILTLDDILRSLESHGLKEVADIAVIENFLAHKEYYKEIILAIGKPAVDGQDAKITYNFDAKVKARPTLKEDGSVDFHQMNAINHCLAGDVLATLQKEVPGIDGCNIYGEHIKAREAKSKSFQYTNNVAVSEDGLSLISQVEGHVLLTDGKVSVSQVYTVVDVGPETGNIEFDGSVEVNGNVCDGYHIHASGNVDVKGVVEGATIQAGGSIIIARGMNGKEKGKLIAGGNVISKYFEHTNVEAKGYIETEGVIHCELSAGTNIHVVGKRGHVMGGRISAGERVEVKTLGSHMGMPTAVALGYHPDHLNKYYELEERVKRIREEEDARRPTLEAFRDKLKKGKKLLPQHMEVCKILVKETKELQHELVAAMKEYELLKEELYYDRNVKDMRHAVMVHDCAYHETTIYMANYSYKVRSAMRNCKFYKGIGEIVMTSCD